MVISTLLLHLLWVFIWNATAIKCATGSAFIVAPLWAFLVKPFLGRRRASVAPVTHANAHAELAERPAAESPRQRRGKAKSKKREKKPEELYMNGTVPEVLQSIPHHRPAPVPVVQDALAELFRSEAFASWYRANRGPLQDRVRLRGAQQTWASLAMAALLLVGACALPLFSFASEDATLVGMIRARFASGTPEALWDMAMEQAEGLAVITAGIALLTSAFMPPEAKSTASTALAAFAVLTAEAATVEPLGIGAGFAVLIGVVVWRVASACE